MNGTIGVSSIEGEGSVFKISVPQEILSFSPVGPLRLIAEQKEYTYTETFRAPKAKILVVDDVAVNLKVVQALLKKTLIEVDTAKSGLQAIDMCRQKKYDLILLDHRMPEPDGIETFRIISEDGFNTDTPVIILTANALSGAEEEYRAMGFSDYLSKPIRSNELELAILRHLPVEKVELV
jgi:CheY-like chemotaxis protein